MSDLPDLADQPLRPAQVAIYVKATRAEKPCAACGSETFTMWIEPDAATGIARGLVTLACDQCNCIRQFLRPPIVAWLRENRRA
jgi:hypothetical protein